MDIEIDDGDSLDRTFDEQRQRGDCKIVEHAVARAEVAVRMMCAAGELTRDARHERLASSRERTTDRRARALHQHVAPRQTDATDDVGRKRAVEDGVDIGGIMRAQQVVARG